MEERAQDEARRRFLWAAASGLGAVGVCGMAVPFIKSMTPAADTEAAGIIEVDLSEVPPGELRVLPWRGRIVGILHRTPEMLKQIEGHDDKLKDPESRKNARVQAPWMKTREQRIYRSMRPEFFIADIVCTHLGCIPVFKPTPGQKDWGDTVPKWWPGGWHCPCHGSYFDLAGRVFKGSPAPDNLYMVPHRYVSDTRVVIGESEEGRNA